MLPKFEVSRDEQASTSTPPQPQAATPPGEPAPAPAPVETGVSVPSQVSFAQEVRAERLGILWKVTLFGVFVLVWVLIVISGGRGASAGDMVIPTLILSIGCIATGQLLNRNLFLMAVWSYALGIILAVGFTLASGSTFSERYAAFVFPLVIFVVGLLIPVRMTLTMTGLVFVVAIVFPTVGHEKFTLPSSTIFALTLTTLATALSAQVSGELFAIAEWALENYRKERRTTFALFESREALEKSFHRQRALTQQLQDTNLQLEVARKSEEEAKNFRGQFLANMSHELRTPLNAIIGFSQTMLDFPAMYDGIELPGQYRQDMNQILSSGKHLLTIINDILDLSKVDAGKLDLEIQPVDIGPIIKGVLSTAVGLVGDRMRQVQLLKELPDPLPIVMGDPLRVRQVLLNLYSNASKFTDSGYIKLKIWAENNEVIFGVEDTGIGISDGDKSTIFEEFRQGTAGRKKGRQGAGLGLAISQQLLRLMHGRVWFESVLGKGSTFFFALPQYQPEGSQTAAKEDTGPVEPVIAPKPAARQTPPAAAPAPTPAPETAPVPAAPEVSPTPAAPTPAVADKPNA
jgi:signal transduction histidine kinase